MRLGTIGIGNGPLGTTTGAGAGTGAGATVGAGSSNGLGMGVISAELASGSKLAPAAGPASIIASRSLTMALPSLSATV